MIKEQIKAKRNQWDAEAKLAACRAIKKGIKAQLTIYPTGLKTMRFAKPFQEFGMHYEVSPETWEKLSSDFSKTGKFYI